MLKFKINMLCKITCLSVLLSLIILSYDYTDKINKMYNYDKIVQVKMI
jgi:hypothetical protein